MKREIYLRIASAWMACLVIVTSPALDAAPAASIQEYRFTIDQYELSFSVPKAFLTDLWGTPERSSPQLIKGRPGSGAYAEYFSHIHMFSGPPWMGDYGAIKFVVMISHADSAHDGSIASLEQLEAYKKWQFEFIKSYEEYSYSKVSFGGVTWLRLELKRNERANPSGKREDENLIFCLPIDDRRFLQVVCGIREYVPGKTSRWLQDADIMRDQILNSMTVRKKAN